MNWIYPAEFREQWTFI